MSIYTGQIGQILRVYSQYVKTKPGITPKTRNTESVKDVVAFSLTSHHKKKLEHLALENISRLTRKNGTPEKS